MAYNIMDITDKDLVKLINRIDDSVKKHNLQYTCLYMYTPRKVAEGLFPDANYADINILISASDISYHTIGTEALTEVIVAPYPMTNFDIYRFNTLGEEIL